MKNLDKTISFRVTDEIYREFYNKYGDLLPQFLRACIVYAVETDYKHISEILFHLY